MENTEQSDKSPKPGATVNEAAAISNADFGWKRVPDQDVTRSVGLDHSLAFHRLQEARQELHLARSGLPALSPDQRARLVAYCEARLAQAEQWVARTSGPKAEIIGDQSHYLEKSANPRYFHLYRGADRLSGTCGREGRALPPEPRRCAP